MNLYIFCQVSSDDVIFRLFRAFFGQLIVKMIVKDGDNTYAPVMFACKMIRQDGYFNRAVSTAAKYYNVDADEVTNHVRARQAAGQQGTFYKRKFGVDKDTPKWYNWCKR